MSYALISGGQGPTRCGRSTAASTRTCTRRCCGRARRPSRWRGPRSRSPSSTRPRRAGGSGSVSAVTTAAGYGQIFIDNGRWWVSKDPDDPNVIRLSDASNPDDGSGLVLASAGQGIGEVAVLESGRRLALTLGSGEEPANLAIVDAVDGTVRDHRHARRAGELRNQPHPRPSRWPTRAGIYRGCRCSTSASGAESVIAENVARLVVARPCATCLPLDPGARAAVHGAGALSVRA